MTFLSNSHTHSTYSDGASTLAQTIEAARRLGFCSLGFSEHASQGFDTFYCMTEDGQREYFRELRAMRERYNDIRIWAGLELDYEADAEHTSAARANADYIIGSTHYIKLDFMGGCVAADGDAATLIRYAEAVYGGDLLRVAREYFDKHVRATLAFKPQIIGHFDLIRKNEKTLSSLDVNGAAYRRLALDALERVYPSGAVLEVNTGGMARGYMDTPYPTLELLGAWREMGGRVTINSDCHNASLLDFAFDKAIALIRDAGYTSVVRLGTGGELWNEVGI